jgi:hypothetical protein
MKLVWEHAHKMRRSWALNAGFNVIKIVFFYDDAEVPEGVHRDYPRRLFSAGQH